MFKRLGHQSAPVLIALVLVGCGSSSPRFTSKWPTVGPATGRSETAMEGIASYYAEEFNKRQTANGEVYDMNDLTAAHRTLPFNTRVRVRNLSNGRSVVVRINDRGPFKNDRIIDLSYEAARQISLIPEGTGMVALEILEVGPQGKEK